MYLNQHPEASIEEVRNIFPPTLVDQVGEKVIDFPFPIWDESDRPGLIKKILVHYYMREIGLETVALWKLRLYDKLNLIMPYYIRLWNSEMDAGDLWETFREYTHTKGAGTDSRYGKKAFDETTGEKDYRSAVDSNRSTDDTDDRYYGVNTKSGYGDSKDGEVGEDKGYGFKSDSGGETLDTTRYETKSEYGDGTSTSKESGDSTSNRLNASLENTQKDDLYSDTPQNGVALVKEGKYLTNARVDTADGARKENSIDSNVSNARGETSQSSESLGVSQGIDANSKQNYSTGQYVDSTGRTVDKDHKEQEIGTSQDITSRVIAQGGTDDGIHTENGSRNIDRENEEKSQEHGAFTKTDDIVHHGWNGDKFDALQKYRDLILNIEEMIVNELRPLFLGIL